MLHQSLEIPESSVDKVWGYTLAITLLLLGSFSPPSPRQTKTHRRPFSLLVVN